MVTGLLLFALMDNPLISQLTSTTYLRVACQRNPIGNQINLRNGSTNCRFGVDSRSDLSLRSYAAIPACRALTPRAALLRVLIAKCGQGCHPLDDLAFLSNPLLCSAGASCPACTDFLPMAKQLSLCL